jgi:hypothetical protein
MNTLQPASKKSSTKPLKNDKKKSKADTAASEVEMTITPPVGYPTATPGSRSSITSRRSVFPDGDFRNTPLENILDMKADVMVNWLHQQQIEKLWSTSLPGEGVVLKKGRDSFTCCPPSLRYQQDSLFDYIAAMNVRVSLNSHPIVNFVLIKS